MLCVLQGSETGRVFEGKDEVGHNMMTKKNNNTMLYHYTSLNSLISILQSKELWLGCAQIMNDHGEVNYYLESLKKEVLRRIPKDNCEDFFAFFQNELALNISSEYPYIFCLTTNGDDVAQWERYGDNGYGVQIGFKLDELQKIITRNKICCEKVKYTIDFENSEIFKALVSCVTTGECGKYGNRIAIAQKLIREAILTKCESFRSESETRIVVFSDQIKKDNSGNNLSFEKKNDIIQQVFKLRLFNQDSNCSFDDLIGEILIGPRSRQKILDLQGYISTQFGLNQVGLNILKSKCTLR